MNKIEFLRYFTTSMISISFGMMVGVVFEVSFKLASWVSVVTATVSFALGMLFTKKRNEASGFIASPITSEKASHLSRIYNLLAVIIFLSPFVYFIYNISAGLLDFYSLSLSAILLFYLLKFVDYQTLITPRTIETNIISILFLCLSTVQLIVLPLTYGISTELRNILSLYITALVFFAHGSWILSMREASSKDLPTTHPKLYYEDMPYRGLYNIIGAFFLIGGSLGTFIFSPKSPQEVILGIAMTVVISLLMAPYLRAFARQGKLMADIRKKREYHKIFVKITKDRWEADVLARSGISRFLNKIVWTVLLFSTFSGLATVYYCIYTGRLEYVIPALVLFSMVYTTFHYRITSRGEKIQDFLRVFRNKSLTSSEVRRLADLALIWCSICAGIQLAVILALKSTNRERSVFAIKEFQITNLTVLTAFFVFSLILIFYFSFKLFSQQGREEADRRNRHALQILVFLTGLMMVVSMSIVFYAIVSPFEASIFSSLAIILFALLFFKAIKDLQC